MKERIGYVIDTNVALKDIIPLFAGYEMCRPSHSYGPHIRDHSIIHICLSGKGVIHDKRGDHSVSGGEFFIIRDGEMTVYTADHDDPWEYLWIGFKGGAVSGFSDERTVFSCPESLMERIKDSVMHTDTGALRFAAYLFELMSVAPGDSALSLDLASKIRRYVKYNYMDEISVDSLSALFGFDRTHLYRVFMKKYGVGIKEFITGTRMSRARDLLLGGCSVADTAYMVGYRDEFNFSKAYKRYFGIPPSKTGKDG